MQAVSIAPLSCVNKYIEKRYWLSIDCKLYFEQANITNINAYHKLFNLGPNVTCSSLAV